MVPINDAIVIATRFFVPLPTAAWQIMEVVVVHTDVSQLVAAMFADGVVLAAPKLVPWIEMLAPAGTVGPFVVSLPEMAGASNVKVNSVVPVVLRTSTCTFGSKTLPAGERQRTIDCVVQVVVPHEVEPIMDVAVAEYVPKLMPATVTDEWPDMGAFSTIISLTTGESYENESVDVPIRAATVKAKSRGRSSPAGD